MLNAKTFEAGSAICLENEVNLFLMKNPDVVVIQTAYAVERKRSESSLKLPTLEYHNCIILYKS